MGEIGVFLLTNEVSCKTVFLPHSANTAHTVEEFKRGLGEFKLDYVAHIHCIEASEQVVVAHQHRQFAVLEQHQSHGSRLDRN